jgi:hypothetical protein
MVGAAAERIQRAHEELLLARHQLRKALEARAALPGRQPGDCGTPSGYRQHKRKKEAPCWACTEGYTWDKKRRL